MNEKGIEKALKSSEVKRQTLEFSEKNSSGAEPSFFDTEKVSSSLPARAPLSQPEERGRGRPKGATNKSTKEWVEFFMNRVKKSPLLFLGELYSQNTEDLARKMLCEREDALKMQIAAANAVLPYVHQKQPVAVQVQAEELPTINIFASQTLFNQFNNGNNQVKREIVIDGIASTTADEISLKNNEIAELDIAESEKKV